MTRPTRDQALAGYLLGMLSADPPPMFVEALANMLRDARAAGVSSTEYLDSPAQPQGAAQAEATPPEAKDRHGDMYPCRCEIPDPALSTPLHCVGCGGHLPASRGGRDARREVKPEPAHDIIRAAEGVTLEPGEYTDESGNRKATVRRPVKSAYCSGAWYFVLGATWSQAFPAVRRVAPVAEPEPVFPEDAFRKFKEGGYMASSREPEPVPESGGELCDCGRPVALGHVRGAGDTPGACYAKTKYGDGHDIDECRNAQIDGTRADRDMLLKERDELRSKVSEAEANSEMDKRSFAQCSDELESVRATLAATEAKSAEAKTELSSAKEVCYELDNTIQDRDAEIARLKAEACDPCAQPLRDSALEDLRGELARLREELASANARVERWRESRDAAVARVRTVINFDRSGLAAGLAHVMAVARGYEWIPEGHWGSYDHEQQTIETLRQETGNLIRGVVDGCMRYLKASGKRADEAAQFKPEPDAETSEVKS